MKTAPGTSFLASRELFLQMIDLERKRAERTGHRLLLVLLHVHSLPEYGAEGVERLVADIRKATREFDAKGWYDKGVLGVLFSEIEGENITEAFDATQKKIVDLLRLAISDGNPAEVGVEFHFFPNEGADVYEPSPFAIHPGPISTGNNVEQVLKRVIDLGGALILLLLLFPLMLAVSIAIRWTSPGPVLFRQERIGRYGRPFMFLKFRSMYTNADAEMHRTFVSRFIAGEARDHAAGSPCVFKITRDPRITPLGRFLRKTSIDELPQLINVLRGEMSLVGPRPPLRYEYEKYALWHKGRLFGTLPGITGLWQVEGRSRTTFADMVRLDLRYIRNWSLFLDIKILLKTPAAVLKGDGAY